MGLDIGLLVGALLTCCLAFAGGGFWLHKKQAVVKCSEDIWLPSDSSLSGKRCRREVTLSDVGNPMFDSLSVSDHIDLSVVALKNPAANMSLTIIADAAFTDLLNVDMKSGNSSLSLSVKEHPHGCCVPVKATLRAVPQEQLTYIAASNASITLDARFLAHNITVKAAGRSNISTSGFGQEDMRQSMELHADHDARVGLHSVPFNHVKTNIFGTSYVTVHALDKVVTQCHNTSQIGIIGEAILEEGEESHCTINRWEPFSPHLVYAVAILLFTVIVGGCGFAFCC